MLKECRECKCTMEMAYESGESFVEEDLCSKCAEALDREVENEDEEHLSDNSDQIESEVKKASTVESKNKDWHSGTERLLSEHSKFKGSGKELVIARPVLDTLIQFCKNERFSEAVRTSSGTFNDCLKKILNGVGNAISDLEVYQRAAAFYFPNAKISFNMSIDVDEMSAPTNDKQDYKRVEINLDELL